MLIYNVTINVDDDVHSSWLSWMKEKHIPEMLATKKFHAAKMCRVLVEEETGGTTYAIQYSTRDRETLDRYYREDAERMRLEGNLKFSGKFVAFRTELEIITEQTL